MCRAHRAGPRRIACALLAGLALAGLACAGAPRPLGPDLYVVRRVGRFQASSREVAASAASGFCSVRDGVMKPSFERTESGPWGEPITELTFRCRSAAEAARR